MNNQKKQIAKACDRGEQDQRGYSEDKLISVVYLSDEKFLGAEQLTT